MEEALTLSESKSTMYAATAQEFLENMTQHEAFMKHYINENNRMKETIKSLTSTFDIIT